MNKLDSKTNWDSLNLHSHAIILGDEMERERDIFYSIPRLEEKRISGTWEKKKWKMENWAFWIEKNPWIVRNAFVKHYKCWYVTHIYLRGWVSGEREKETSFQRLGWIWECSGGTIIKQAVSLRRPPVVFRRLSPPEKARRTDARVCREICVGVLSADVRVCVRTLRGGRSFRESHWASPWDA